MARVEETEAVFSSFNCCFVAPAGHLDTYCGACASAVPPISNKPGLHGIFLDLFSSRWRCRPKPASGHDDRQCCQHWHESAPRSPAEFTIRLSTRVQKSNRSRLHHCARMLFHRLLNSDSLDRLEAIADRFVIDLERSGSRKHSRPVAQQWVNAVFTVSSWRSSREFALSVRIWRP